MSVPLPSVYTHTIVPRAAATAVGVEIPKFDWRARTKVMAVWAIAWAGSKPLASFADGSLAGFVGIQLTGIILALPAFVPIGYLIVKRYLPQLRALHRAPSMLPAVTVPADDLISPESFPVLDAT